MQRLPGLLQLEPLSPCRSPMTRPSTGDTQTLSGRSGSASCGSHCSFPLVLVHTRFCLHPPSVSGGSADGDFDHEIKRCLFLGRKAMANLDSVLKSRDIIFLAKVCLVKAMVFPVVMYGCESWTIKKAEH